MQPIVKIHPITGEEIFFTKTVSCTYHTTAFCDANRRYIFYQTFRQDKWFLLKFQQQNPDKILLPGLVECGSHMIANYLYEYNYLFDKLYTLVNYLWNKNYDDIDYDFRVPRELLKLRPTIKNALSFLEFVRNTVADWYVLDVNLSNFRMDKFGKVYWFDPIVC